MHGAGISDANEHSHINLPLVMVGGAGGSVKGNRILRYPVEAQTPMNALHMAMLDKMGVHIDQFGDANKALNL